MSSAQVLKPGERARFEEVPSSVLEGDWKVTAAKEWRRLEHITALECEGFVCRVRQLARKCSNFGCRHVILGDNLGAVSAWVTGRSSRFAIRRRMLEAAACCVAFNLQVYCRWIPGEANPADEPNRRFDQKSEHHGSKFIRDHSGSSEMHEQPGELGGSGDEEISDGQRGATVASSGPRHGVDPGEVSALGPLAEAAAKTAARAARKRQVVFAGPIG